MRWDPLRAITRRALWINYRSPMICALQEPSSGSGSVDSSLLNTEPTFRLPGPTLSGSVQGAGLTVVLDWTSVPTAFAYVVYRADTLEGPYTIRASGILDTHFEEEHLIGQTVYYKVTGIEPNFGETEASNTISLT